VQSKQEEIIRKKGETNDMVLNQIWN